MNLTKEQIAITALSVLSGVLLLGWVLPDYAYTRRLSKDKADALLDEYKKLYLKNYLGIKADPNKYPVLSKEEQNRWNEIELALIKAGYRMGVGVNEENGTVYGSLGYPKYAI